MQRERSTLHDAERRGAHGAGGGGPAGERWLVLSHAANLNGTACSHHIDDRLPHLAAAGVEVHMITSTEGPRPPGWGGRWRRVPSPTASGLQYEVGQLTRRMPRPWGRLAKLLLALPVAPLYQVEKHALRLERSFGWWLSAAAMGLWETRRARYDLVYSTGGPPSAHLAALVIAAARRLPWLAELQDPLVFQGIGKGPLSDWATPRLERLVHEHAAGVVYVTRRARDAAVARTQGRAPSTVIYPGAEPLEPGPPNSEPEMRIAHVGTLDRRRSPRTLLRALARLAERHPQARREVRLLLIGHTGGAVTRLARAFPYPQMVSSPGKLGRAQARAALSASDLLVLIQHDLSVSRETIPSKTYEYLAAGRPVVALGYQNPELREMLEAAGHVYVEVDDLEGVARAIEESYQRWRTGALRAPPPSPYTVAAAVAQLLDWSRAVRQGGLLDHGN